MTSTSGKSELQIVLGAMTFGEPGKGQTRVFELEDVNKIIDVFQQHGHTEVDTARLYGQGTSEEYLGKIGWQKRGLVMETKLYPSVAQRMRLQTPNAIEITHSAEDVKKHFQASLNALEADKVDMFYLHGPDRSTPFDVTLKAVDDLYRQGKFRRFGISNYHCWEVAEIVTLCRANGWIQPTAYQGLYNALHRAVEPELFPALRKYGLAFYAYNPLGGGIFTGRYRGIDAASEEGARFDPNTAQGKTYRQRYWNEGYFAAIETVEAAAKQAGLSMTETALRWMSHHSLMKRQHGDAVIIGASSVKHLEENLADLEKGPLPQDVVDAVNAAWRTVAADNNKYWH